jgi:hypothetical protein
MKGPVDMLCLFIFQVVKKEGNMYPLTMYFFLILFFFFNFVCLFSLSNFLYFSLFFMFYVFFFIHGSIQALIRKIGRLFKQR